MVNCSLDPIDVVHIGSRDHLLVITWLPAAMNYIFEYYFKDKIVCFALTLFELENRRNTGIKTHFSRLSSCYYRGKPVHGFTYLGLRVNSFEMLTLTNQPVIFQL